ncbi:related to 30s ribosomal protein s18 [Ustilago bromivora]|nr:related to 30s ribosomal protein s18 [Ustilago bromivora]
MKATTSLINATLRTAAFASTGRTTLRWFTRTCRTLDDSSSSSSSSTSPLDELSSSIERLAALRSSTPSSASASTTAFSIHNPRSSTPPASTRQTVSGRAFMNGHYYNPSTLSFNSITQRAARLARPLLGPTKKEAMSQDLIYQNGLNPAKASLNDDTYKNAAILANYVSEMGKILPRSSTGLTRKSQRQVGKAVRRARSMGLLPVMSRGGARSAGAGWK